MRTSKRRVVVLAVILIAGVLSALLLVHSAGPYHAGRPLSSWLDGLRSTNIVVRERAKVAVRAIGTNAVPTVLDWLSYRNRPLGDRVRSALTKFGLHSLTYRRSQAYYKSTAVRAFFTLGPLAEGALPDLRRLLLDPDPDTFRDAATAIAFVSPLEAEKLLTDWSADTNPADTNQIRRVSYLRQGLGMRQGLLKANSW